MANEKTWSTVPPQALTANGGSLGQVQVADTAGFRVKALVTISAPGLPDLNLQVKRVVDSKNLYVGDKDKPLSNHAYNLSLYTVSSGATITQPEQDKTKLRPDDMEQATYETDPINGWRVLSVDQYGNPYSEDNPMPLTFDGTLQVGDVEVVGPNGNVLKPNADGSINVIVTTGSGMVSTVINRFAETTAVPVSSVTTINTYSVPTGYQAFLQRISVSGENNAKYSVQVNGNTVDVKRTWWGHFNADFEFLTDEPGQGYSLNAGDVVTVLVENYGQVSATFDSRIQAIQIVNQS